VTTGFNQMLVQCGVVLLFQAVFGNIYSMLGLVSAGAMVGLALGAWKKGRSLGSALVVGMAVLTASAMTAPFIAGHDGVAVIFFIIVPLASGYCGGWQFASAAQGMFSTGLAYGLDVLGASLGALLGGLFLIPLWGLPMSFAFGAVLQAALIFGNKM
jgi:hypothetical protein